ncbi:peptidase M16 [Hoylesella buccalis]|uniref:Peptidase M16 n=1 Tax=Hoylesella buccalis TaxID=28127 RepID=A0A2N6QSR9_9BACT|nr:M16 family metallopeptidase [Hoylesella buccalis]PMC25017.1 peptidase M16 [Hoylesella buccalis]
MKHLLWRALLGLAILPSMTQAAGLPQALPIDTAVRIGTLDNGLKYYIRHNNWPEKRANFYIVQRVGSIQEEENQRGLAHFLEHMCFNGTKNFPGNNVIRYCESLGVKFGGDLNAYTSIDQTVYNISNVPTKRQNALDSCLLILHDWANGLTLDTQEIDKERGVIHEEWRERTGANSRMLERNLPTLYSGSKYGSRFPIGLMSVVDNFKPAELRAYYEKWYHPSNQCIIVVGDVDVDHTERMIRQMFGTVTNPADIAPIVAEQVPDNDTPIVVIDKDKEQPNSAVEALFKHDPWPDSLKNSMDYVMANYVRNVAIGMLNDRYAEAAQKSGCPYLGAEAADGTFIFAKTKNAFRVSAAPRSIELTAKALKTALAEAHRAADQGFTQIEYDRAKKNLLNGLERAYNNKDKRGNASFADDYKGNYLSNEPIPAFEEYYYMMRQAIPQIPLEEVNRVLPNLLPKSDHNLVIINFNNEKEGNVYPKREDLLEAVKQARQANFEAYVDTLQQQPLMKKLPRPGRIVKEKKNDKFGFTELKLSNGVTVVLKKTDFKKGQVGLSAIGPGGKSLYGKKDFANLAAFDDIVGSSALGGFTGMQLPKILAGKTANAHLSIGDKYMGVGGSAAKQDVETMLQLVYLYFTNIGKDEKAVANLMDGWRTSLKNRNLSHETIYSDSLSATLYGHNPRLRPFLEEHLKDIDYDRILQIARERTANASAWTFTFVGDYDESTIRPLVCRYLGSLPTKGKVRHGHLLTSYQKGVVENVFHRKMQTPKAMACMVWHNTDMPYTLDGAMKMNMIGQILSMVYLKKIREDAGAAYSCGADGSAEIEGDFHAYSLVVTCPVKPEKSDIALKIMREEAERMTTHCDETMLEKVKAYMLKNADLAVKTNTYWRNVIGMYRRYGMDTHSQYKDVIKEQTVKGLCDFMKEFLQGNNRVTVVMLPQE